MIRLGMMLLWTTVVVRAQAPIDFARDVQPILSDNCYRCHGPDGGAREAGLRLDDRANAVSERDGVRAIVPGDPSASELIKRVRAASVSDRMPPAHTGKTLTAEEITTLERWIAQGAPWGRHWSFVPPVRPPVADEVHPVDHFVRRRLRAAGLSPSPEADRRTLIRRLSFDLTGLPPSPSELRAFLEDDEPGAYERLVDRLLASPHYGERMAMVWLDAARYADTDGYQQDATRSNWPWRDWVVDAYNQNMPFDEFTRLQFAGDLLDSPTPEQILATCFHRNHMTNGEGGRLAEESRIDYVIDRVNTFGTVFLGMTLGCAQCHDHKFDPVSQKEYYGLNAYFNSIDEDGRAGSGAKPYLQYRSKKVGPGLRAAKQWLSARKTALAAVEKEARKDFLRWRTEKIAAALGDPRHASWTTPTPRSVRATHGAKLRIANDGSVVASGPNARHDDYLIDVRPDRARITGFRLQVLPEKEGAPLSASPDGHFILTNLKVSVRSSGRQFREIQIRSAVADYQAKKAGDKAYGPVRDVLDDDPRTGWTNRNSDPKEKRVAVFGFERPVALLESESLLVELHHRSLSGRANIRRFRLDFTSERGPTLARAGPTPMERVLEARGDIHGHPALEKDLLQQFLAERPEVQAARAKVNRARLRVDTYDRATRPVKVMVLRERKKPRTTHVLIRGAWDQKGEVVAPHVPQSLGKGTPKDRLELANWLVDGQNPLTARVAVNRYWQMYFGVGLVRTPEDFGRQGAPPTHPDLLDWLAAEFVSSGWDVKHLQKLIVTSATYRQSSRMSPELLERDPDNRLLARAARFRLPSWMIRDAALRASGLLTTRRGGPPVFPYQPEGVWAAFSMGRFHYEHGVGDDLHRRSLYGFWRRLVAPTGMFDASKRRTCQIRVIRTNTPLQALTLMNDVTFVEAARVIAGRILKEVAGDDGVRVAHLFERITGRAPAPGESRELMTLLTRCRAHYATHPDEASALLSQGAAPNSAGVDAVEQAAWSIVASTLFNLDETVTRE